MSDATDRFAERIGEATWRDYCENSSGAWAKLPPRLLSIVRAAFMAGAGAGWVYAQEHPADRP